jgi:hypothetical protein
MFNQTTAEQAAKNRGEKIDDTKTTDGHPTRGSDERVTPTSEEWRSDSK